MLALIAALAGTGLAASKLTKKEKAQVKKLIVNKAPSLSVADATGDTDEALVSLTFAREGGPRDSPRGAAL